MYTYQGSGFVVEVIQQRGHQPIWGPSRLHARQAWPDLLALTVYLPRQRVGYPYCLLTCCSLSRHTFYLLLRLRRLFGPEETTLPQSCTTFFFSR